MGVSIRSRKLASRSRSRANVYGRLKPKRCASYAIHRIRASCARFWKGHREITYKKIESEIGKRKRLRKRGRFCFSGRSFSHKLVSILAKHAENDRNRMNVQPKGRYAYCAEDGSGWVGGGAGGSRLWDFCSRASLGGVREKKGGRGGSRVGRSDAGEDGAAIGATGGYAGRAKAGQGSIAAERLGAGFIFQHCAAGCGSAPAGTFRGGQRDAGAAAQGAELTAGAAGAGRPTQCGDCQDQCIQKRCLAGSIGP